MNTFEDRLRGELVAAIDRSQRPAPARVGRGWFQPSRWPVAVAAATALALALVALPAILRTDRALAIDRAGASATITLVDPEASVERLNEELAAAGLRATVRREPASPSAVGSWLGLVAGGAAAGLPTVGATMTLSTKEAHAVELLLGAAAPDGPYTYSASAFQPGEPLNCSGLALSSAVSAAQAVQDRGLSPQWFVLTEDGRIERADGDAIPAGVVTGAEMQSSTSVRIYVSLGGIPEAPASQDDPRYVLEGDPDEPPPDHLLLDQGRYATDTAGSQCPN